MNVKYESIFTYHSYLRFYAFGAREFGGHLPLYKYMPFCLQSDIRNLYLPVLQFFLVCPRIITFP